MKPSYQPQNHHSDWRNKRFDIAVLSQLPQILKHHPDIVTVPTYCDWSRRFMQQPRARIPISVQSIVQYASSFAKEQLFYGLFADALFDVTHTSHFSVEQV